MRQIKFITALIAITALVLTSCDDGVTYIDNPTSQAIELTIDGKKPITVAAKEFKRMDKSLSQGKHSMQIENGEAIEFNLDKNHVMLNPTLSIYVTVVQEYGTGFQSSANDTTIVIDDVEYYGPFIAVSNAPFVYTGNINLMVDKPIPDQIETSKTGNVALKKLFRKDEFIEYYEEEYR